MYRKLLYFIAIFCFIIISSYSSAVPPGKTVEYDGGGAGNVSFDGTDHKIRGISCIDCHPDIFVMKGNIRITMDDIYAGKFCGACHNGIKGFDARKQDTCNRCHK